jgi:hypothetical protein
VSSSLRMSATITRYACVLLATMPSLILAYSSVRTTQGRPSSLCRPLWFGSRLRYWLPTLLVWTSAHRPFIKRAWF